MTTARHEAAAVSDGIEIRRRPHVLAVVAALSITTACLIPFLLWGNPYPDAVVRYWLWGTVLSVGLTTAAARLPVRQLHELPQLVSKRVLQPSARTFAAGVAIAAALLGVAAAIYSFSRSPSTPDEIALLWQAQILLRGRLSLPVDPAPEFFSLETIVDIGRWYGQSPIGGAVVMLPGALLKVPWLVNPLLSGVSVAALYHFARRAYGELQGRLTALLFVLSPIILLMTGTWMNHVPTLCVACCTLAALIEWERAKEMRRRLTFAAAIGLGLGFIATIRPLDAVVVAGVVGMFQLFVAIRDDRRRFIDVVVQGVFGSIGVAPLFIANALTTGNPLTFGYDVLWGAGHRVGFHADPHGNVHTLQRGMELAVTYVSELNMYLLAWPVPALALLIVGLLMMRHITRWDALMLGFFGAQVAAYAAYWGEGEFLGPRFLYTALPAVIVLLVRGGAAAMERAEPFGRRAITMFALICVTLAWIPPRQSFNAQDLARQARYARRNLKLDIAGAIEHSNAHNALVFLREPLGMRLARRMWGLGVSRSTAARLIADRDACSLLAAVRTGEADNVSSIAARTASIERNAARLPPDGSGISLRGGSLRIASMASIDDQCRAELDADTRIGSVPFGPALPLQPIGADGRIAGDVIFAADLGERNELLRARFGDRPWYRLISVPGADGSLRIGLAPY